MYRNVPERSAHGVDTPGPVAVASTSAVVADVSRSGTPNSAASRVKDFDRYMTVRNTSVVENSDQVNPNRVWNDVAVASCRQVRSQMLLPIQSTGTLSASASKTSSRNGVGSGVDRYVDPT
jgi:hypothetical protein